LKLNQEDLKLVTQRIIELGDKKETVTKEDLPYIISDVLDSHTYEEKIKIESYILVHSKGMRPSTTLCLKFGDEIIEENAQGDGQFDAFMNALAKIYKSKKLTLPKLIDYAVRIPPGSSSDALCETIITWVNNEKEFKTRGLDSDQTVAAIIATQKMLNVIA
jgi:D-citramalate synthase